MSKILLVDAEGMGLDFALRSLAWGHEVKWFNMPNKDGTRDKAGDGLVEKVSDWKKWLRWADLILMTGNSKYMDYLDYYKKLGYPVFAAGLEGTRLEVDRAYGMEVLKKHGIPSPAYQSFNSFDEAEKHVWKTKKRYVFKTLGDEEDKSLSYVPKSPAQLIGWMRGKKKNGKALKGKCMLQEFIPGIEMGVAGWMGPKGFLKDKWEEHWEFKKLMSGEFGPNTGEAGTVLQYKKKSKLADMVLKPLESYLISIGYIGDIAVNCIIDESGKPNPLEFTARLGWPDFFIRQSLHEGDPAQWMIDLMDGKDTLQVHYDVAVGVVLAHGRFPHTSDKNVAAMGVTIYGIDEKNWDNIHPAEMMLGKGVDMEVENIVEKEMFVTSGEYVMVVSGTGESVHKAAKACYKLADDIGIDNMQARDDIGEKLKDCLPELHEKGFALGTEY